jgi:hypothetical protein
MGSPDGATLYSLIETAKLNYVNPEGYLKFLMEHTIDANDITLMENLMPWNANIENGYINPSLKPKNSEKDLELNLKTQLETIKIQKNTS